MFEKSTVELIDHMGDDMRACHAARVSLLNDGDDLSNNELTGRDVKLIHFLMREKHTSPFEHSTITFRIHAPLPVVAQIMRHRVFSYNQASRRYTSEQICFFDMADWRKQGEKNLQCSDGKLSDSSAADVIYRGVCESGLDAYNKLLDMGCSREQARFVLPQGLMARFYMTGNLHNFMKFLILRDDDHAQPECREVAQAIRLYLTQIFPITMNFFDEIVGKKG